MKSVPGAALFVLCGVACGSAPQAKPQSAASASTAPAPEPSTNPPPPVATASSEQPAISTPSSQTLPIAEACLGMCARLEQKCPATAVEACRINCGKYEPPPEGCGDVVLAALECARGASDLVCANVAPESCARKFRDVTVCAAGQRPATQAAASTSLPEGFAMYRDEQYGISAPLPEQRDPQHSESDVLVSALHPDGARYTIRKLARPDAPQLNQKIFLKVAMNLLGRCSDKMKLQGLVEKAGRASMHYTTTCPDGSEERGLFWGTDTALFVASVRGPAGRLGPTDTFLYGFEVK